MTQIRFFTDEDVFASLARALRSEGFDAISTPEASRRRETDESQLDWATQQGRTIFTFNGGDYAAIHTRWLKQGKHHAGVIVSAQRSRGDLLRRIRQLAAVLDADAMQDRLEYLGNW